MSLYEYRATVLKVTDGDTADFRIDCGFNIFHDMKVRFAGLNAPEMKTHEGKLAKRWLESKLPVGLVVTIKTEKDKTEKYGRYLATVILEDFTNINEELVKAGHATEYDGGKR